MLPSLDNKRGIAFVTSVDQLRDLIKFMSTAEISIRFALIFGGNDTTKFAEELQNGPANVSSATELVKLRSMKGLVALSSQLGCRHLVIGCPHATLSQLIIRLFRWSQLVLLDDGIVTYRLRAELQSKFSRNRSSITFFSKYSNINSEEWGQIWGAEYRAKSITLDHGMLGVIGSPMLESGMIEENEFRAYLKRAIDLYVDKGMRVLYFPHRREVLSRRIVEEEGLAWVGSTLDIGTVRTLQGLGKVPATFVTFYSSAILDVRLLLRGHFSARLVILEPEVKPMSMNVDLQNAFKVSKFIRNVLQDWD